MQRVNAATAVMLTSGSSVDVCSELDHYYLNIEMLHSKIQETWIRVLNDVSKCIVPDRAEGI